MKSLADACKLNRSEKSNLLHVLFISAYMDVLSTQPKADSIEPAVLPLKKNRNKKLPSEHCKRSVNV